MKYLLIVLMLFPVAVIAQKNNVFKISTKAARTTKFANGLDCFGLRLEIQSRKDNEGAAFIIRLPS